MKRFGVILCLLAVCFALLLGCDSQDGDSRKDPLRVLAIGNSYSRDCMYYLPALADLDGYTVEAAYLEAENASLRDHAHNLTFYSEAYTLWRSGDNNTFTSHGVISIGDVLEQNTWDVIILQHHPYASGFPTTYNGDLQYILDYLQENTTAKIYWNMSWAMEDSSREDAFCEEFGTYYDNSQVSMYNAIVDCLDKYIAGNNATFRNSFDGYIPTGSAIQKLRAIVQHDKALTSNGANLSFDIGRLSASMTLLKTLLPDFNMDTIGSDAVSAFLNTTKTDSVSNDTDASEYIFSEKDLSSVVEVVTAVCQSEKLPKKLPTEPAETSGNADITLLQSVAPMKLHFPDAAVLSDGTVIVGAYEAVHHKPDIELGEAQGGGGTIYVWASKDHGATRSSEEPLLTVNETQMEKWGLANVSQRYSTLASGSFDYHISIDPRDPNFGVVHTDVTGDGAAEEVLLFTFWAKFYTENISKIDGTTKCYLLWSIDGGNTWSEPQQLIRSNPKDKVLKRGNIAAFSDGQILIPYYSANKAGSLLMEFNTAQNKWVLLQDNAVPNLLPTEGEKFNEVSFVAPDPDSNTVFAYCRENGTVLRSLNRGKGWELIGNQDGLIHQPSFAIIDKERVFTTWALPKRPRNTYGKVFYVNRDWTDTQEQLIYESSDPVLHDMADPSCVLLSDGRILTVSYDTAYRSIVGVYCDLSEAKWLPE